MFRKLVFTLILSVASFVVASAHSLEAKRGAVKDGYNFWLYTPDSVSTANPKPVVIFLHGASLCGNDLNRVRRYGTIDAVERGRKIDAYVIAPQNPGGAWSPKKVMNVLDWVMDHGSVDSTRVYVLGMSLGGYGTLDVTAAYPDRIAAAMAFCGGSTSRQLSNLNEVPLWIVHGTGDKAVSVGESDKVVSAMRAAGGGDRLVYDRVPGMNHSQPARFFYMQQCYDWLFAHSLTDEGRPLQAHFDITGSASAYADLNHKAKASASSPRAKSKSSRHTASKSKSKKSSGKRSARVKK